MATTRLSQKGIGVAAYVKDRVIECGKATYTWRARNLDRAAYIPSSTTRLGQHGVQTARYPDRDENVIIPARRARWSWAGRQALILANVPLDAATADYTWTTSPAGVNLGITPPLTSASYTWHGHDVVVCGFSPIGYRDSFNGATWNTCCWNEFTFGPRTKAVLNAGTAVYGWQSRSAFVQHVPQVNTTTAGLNWQAYPSAVSFASQINCHEAPYGWAGQPAEIDFFVSFPILPAIPFIYTWAPRPVSLVYESTIYCQRVRYSWQPQPATVELSGFDIQARTAHFRWAAQQATLFGLKLLPGDIEAIAEAVWQRMVSEGAVQQWLEVWQRMGMDPAHPQTFRHPNNGGNIEVAGITVEQTETDEDVTQHRQ